MKNITTKLAILAAALCLVAIFTSCNGDAAKKALIANEWSVDKITYTDGTLELVAPVGVYIIFSDSARVNGRGGCNNYMGSYEITGKDQIKMGKLASTMMYCDNMPFEDAYIKLLEKVTTFTVKNNVMTLTNGEFSIIYAPRDVVAETTKLEEIAKKAAEEFEAAAKIAAEEAEAAAKAVIEPVKKAIR